jgi:hypothetical protein
MLVFLNRLSSILYPSPSVRLDPLALPSSISALCLITFVLASGPLASVLAAIFSIYSCYNSAYFCSCFNSASSCS